MTTAQKEQLEALKAALQLLKIKIESQNETLKYNQNEKNSSLDIKAENKKRIKKGEPQLPDQYDCKPLLHLTWAHCG